MPPKSSLTWNHNFFQNILEKILLAAHRLVRGLANRLLDNNYTNQRLYSNTMLKHYAPFFKGDIINVSGASDTDYHDNFYKNYFTQADSYVVSNASTDDKGLGSVKDVNVKEIEIDLNYEVPSDLNRKYDVVLNHTTLEHVFNIKTAFKNLCDMSKDSVIIVVPVIQQIHIRDSFGDYFRPTTMAIAKMFKENGFEPVVILTNNQPFAAIYCFAIGMRNPENHPEIEKLKRYNMGDYLYGGKLDPESLERTIS